MAYIGWLALTIPVAIFRGWALSLLWLWFIVPIFHAPVLSVAASVGVITVASGISITSMPKKDEDENYNEQMLLRCAFTVIYTLMVLLQGYIVSFYL